MPGLYWMPSDMQLCQRAHINSTTRFPGLFYTCSPHCTVINSLVSWDDVCFYETEITKFYTGLFHIMGGHEKLSFSLGGSRSGFTFILHLYISVFSE
eukprot:sb/3479023/